MRQTPPFIFSPCHPCSANFTIKRNQLKSVAIYLSIRLSDGREKKRVCGLSLVLFPPHRHLEANAKRRSSATRKKNDDDDNVQGLKKWVNSSERGHVVKKGMAINIPVDCLRGTVGNVTPLRTGMGDVSKNRRCATW